MSSALFDHVHRLVYTRADMLRALGVVREFLSFVCFTKGREAADAPELIKEFAADRALDDEERTWLQQIPAEAWSAFTRDTFHSTLDACIERIDTLPHLSLTLAAALPPAQMRALGEWVRTEIDPQLLLNIEIDTNLGVGCRFVWKSKLHDYSLAHFLHASGGGLRERLSARLSELASTNAPAE